MKTALENALQKNQLQFCSIVDFSPVKDKLFHLDFTSSNSELAKLDIANTTVFTTYINDTLKKENARFGIGGYNENRVIYKRSELFNNTEPRCIHLGIDIWGAIKTPIKSPLGGIVHSYSNNNAFGDYGPTIILQHQVDTIVFYTLYGHLCSTDLNPLRVGKFITRGEIIGHFGEPFENGDWPPHLHFQIIEDIKQYKGDYPGVCTPSESKKMLSNSPDPDLILDFMKYTSVSPHL